MKNKNSSDKYVFQSPNSHGSNIISGAVAYFMQAGSDILARKPLPHAK